MNSLLVALLILLIGAILPFWLNLAGKGYDRRKAYRDMLTEALDSLERGKRIDLRAIRTETEKIRADIVFWKRWLIGAALDSLSKAEQDYQQTGVEDLSRLIATPNPHLQSMESIGSALRFLRWCAK
jgi:hypothetical protein